MLARDGGLILGYLKVKVAEQIYLWCLFLEDYEAEAGYILNGKI